MGQTKQRLSADLKRANYAESTQKKYIRQCERFVAHYMRPVDELGRDEIKTCLDTFIDRLDLAGAVRGAGPSLVEVDVAGEGPEPCEHLRHGRPLPHHLDVLC